MERYENIIKIEEIRRLIDENLYTKAAKILDTMDISRIKSITDLSIIADVLTQNDRYEDAVEILLKIYNKTKTRRVLYQLVDISIRMEDLEKANEYLKMYIKIAPTDSHRFIFRYCIDKINQEPYEILLDSLEQLKEYDYIEMWAYELAKVYHKAGMKDKCVRECSDIILWFGEGVYVEKAKLLKAFYVGEINPANIINAKNKKEAFLRNLEKTRDYSAMRDEINEYLAKEEKEMEIKQSEKISYHQSFMNHGDGNAEDILSQKKFVDPIHDIAVTTETFKSLEVNSDVAIHSHIELETDIEREGYINPDKTIGTPPNTNLIKDIDMNIDAGIDTGVEYKDGDTDNATYKTADINTGNNTDRNASKDTDIDADIEAGKDTNKDADIDASKDTDIVTDNDTYKDADIDTGNAPYKDADIDTDKEAGKDIIDACKDTDIIANYEADIKSDVNTDMEPATDGSKDMVDIDTNADSNPDTGNSVNTDTSKDIVTDIGETELAIETTHYSKAETDVFDYFEMAGFLTQEEFGAFLLVKGLKEQIQVALENILSDAENINYLVIAGKKKSGRSTLAKKICKGLFALQWIKSPKVAKISGDKLNYVDLSKQKEKLVNSTIVVEDASCLTEETCHKLVDFMEEMRGSIFVILEDEHKNMREFFLRYPFLRTYFVNGITLEDYSDRELFRFAEEYIKQQDYQFLTESKSEFFQKIGQILNGSDKPFKEVMDLAKAVVESADNRYKGQLAEILNNRNLDTEDLLYIVKEDILEV